MIAQQSTVITGVTANGAAIGASGNTQIAQASTKFMQGTGSKSVLSMA